MGNGRNAARPVPAFKLDGTGAVWLIDPIILGPKSGTVGLVGDLVGDRGGLPPGTDLENLELAVADEPSLEFAAEDDEKIEGAAEEVDCVNNALVPVAAALDDPAKLLRFGERWGARVVEGGCDGGARGGTADGPETEAVSEGGDVLG